MAARQGYMLNGLWAPQDQFQQIEGGSYLRINPETGGQEAYQGYDLGSLTNDPNYDPNKELARQWGLGSGQYAELLKDGFDPATIGPSIQAYLAKTGNSVNDVNHWGNAALNRVMGRTVDPVLEKQQQNQIAAQKQWQADNTFGGLSGGDWGDILKGAAFVGGAGTLGNMFNAANLSSVGTNAGNVWGGWNEGLGGTIPDVTGSMASSGSFQAPDSWMSSFNSGVNAATSGNGVQLAGEIPNGGIIGSNPTSIGDYASQFTGGGPEAWTDPALSESLANMSGNVQAASATQSGNLWDTILSKLKSGVGNEINKATNNPISTALGLYGGLRNMFSEQTRANDIRSGYSNAAQLANPVNPETRQRYQAMLQQAMTNPESLIQEGGPLAGITKVYNDATQRAMAAKGRRLNPADLQNENYKTFLGTILPNYTKQLADLGGFQFNPGAGGQIMAGGILPAAQAEANSQGALPFALQAIFGRANTPTRGVNGQLVGG